MLSGILLYKFIPKNLHIYMSLTICEMVLRHNFYFWYVVYASQSDSHEGILSR